MTYATTPTATWAAERREYVDKYLAAEKYDPENEWKLRRIYEGIFETKSSISKQLDKINMHMFDSEVESLHKLIDHLKKLTEMRNEITY